MWGHEHDYTETDGWNFAFHAPQDGQGLANLYGGRDGLARKLDTFFSTPETAKFPGSYGGIIHEMIEARDVRMGQWGFSNQVSHHIPYMYDYAGQPSKTQAKVREALRRLYLGSEIGQGYAGDEDNGETSAWYLFSALGFYPLQVGSPNYAIGSPLFKKATVHLENGHDLVVKRAEQQRAQRLRPGPEGQRAALRPRYLAPPRHRRTAGRSSSTWARSRRTGRPGRTPLPPSVTKGDAPAAAAARHDGRRRRDRDGERRRRRGAVRRRLEHRGVADGPQPWLQYRFTGSRPVQLLHADLGHRRPAATRARWVVKGSNDGERWKVLDERSDETFPWRSQTRPFKLARPGNYAYYRIEVTESGGGTARRGRAAQPGQGRHLAARHRGRPAWSRRRATRCR